MTTSPQKIPLNQLVQWPGNVRKTRSKTAVAEMKASVNKDGLLQNLIVLPQGKTFAVVDGQTRFTALNELVKEGLLSPDFPVPVEITTEENAHAVSLAANTIRENMNAADEAEAFAALVKQNIPKVEIGQRYGRTELYVEQRLKIAEACKEALTAYRRGEINLEQLQALTTAKSHEDQKEVLKRVLGNGYFDRSPSGIREALKGDDTVELDDIRLKVVPLNDYLDAGGTIHKPDLFSDEDNAVIEDVKLLDKLVTEKADSRIEKVKKEGWSWVEPRISFGYSERSAFTVLEPDYKPLPPKQQQKLDELRKQHEHKSEAQGKTEWDSPEYDELEAEIEKLADSIDKLEAEREEFWSPEKLSIAGAVVYIGDKGLTVERGLVKADKKAAAKKIIAAAKGEDEQDAKPEKAKPEFFAGLIQDLTQKRSAALTATLMKRPKEAHLALYHRLIEDVFFDTGSDESAIQIGVREKFFDDVKGAKADAEIAEQYKALKKKLPAQNKLWEWVLKADAKKIAEYVAFCVAVGLNWTQTKNDSPKQRRFTAAANIADAVDFDMKKYFTADAENYFSRVSKEQVFTALKEVDATMPSNNFKRDQLNKYAAQQVAGKGWLPKPLR